jgi:hypothetical protein
LAGTLAFSIIGQVSGYAAISRGGIDTNHLLEFHPHSAFGQIRAIVLSSPESPVAPPFLHYVLRSV